MFMQSKLNYRTINAFLVFMAVAGSVFAIGFLQKYLGLDPCPLCIFQRLGLWSMGFFALLGLIFNPKNKAVRLLLWLGAMLGTLWGLGVASRHVWLQSLPPDQVPACGPGLNYLMDTFPLMQVFSQVLTGSGECASIDWTLFGITLPQMTLALFVFLAGCLLFLLQKIIKA